MALDGSILRCSNIDDKVATIDEDIRTILWKMKEANTIPLMEKCKTCPYAALNGKGAGCSVDYAISDGASCKICEAYGKVIIEEFCRFSRESCWKEKPEL